jgi:hypothetical protein
VQPFDITAVDGVIVLPGVVSRPATVLEADQPAKFLPRGNVPEANAAIGAAGGQQLLAVAGQGDVRQPARVAGENADLFAAPHVPEPGRAVVTASSAEAASPDQ